LRECFEQILQAPEFRNVILYLCSRTLKFNSVIGAIVVALGKGDFSCMERKGRHKKEKKGIYKKSTYAVVAVVSILGLGCLIYSLSRPSSPTFQYKAAIVDQLSHPDWGTANQTFVNASTTMLDKAGFKVDYYDWEKVSVNFYRNLPQLGYGLIVLRVHSAAGNISGVPSLALFTSEPYSAMGHYLDQISKPARVVKVSLVKDVGPYYFGIAPAFVRDCMGDGRFRFVNTTIIMMGCDGLNTNTTEMAKAFVEKGAKVYIGWDLHVTASHTDQATTRLLYHLVVENQTVEMALNKTMYEVGQDLAYNSRLDYYPDEAGGYTIPKAVASMTTSVTETINWVAPSCIKRKVFYLQNHSTNSILLLG